MIRHFNISVFGHVQGVGFRYSALNVARKLEISGFVKNCTDGSVYIEIEGTDDRCESFLTWCRRGPGYGRVDRVEVTETGVRNFRNFTIR